MNNNDGICMSKIDNMKVLHINCNYLTTALHQIMIQKLDILGVENTVFVPTSDVSNSVIDYTNENTIVSECFTRKDRLFYFGKQTKILNSVESNVKNINEYNCIHAYTLFTDGNVAMRLSKKYNIPYVVAIRDTDMNVFLKYRKHLMPLALKILKNASAIFFLSKSYKEQIINNYIFKNIKDEIEKKSYIIPNGIDDFWHKNNYYKENYKVNAKHLKIIYIGRISVRKNISTTIKALNILRNEGVKVEFTIIGNIDDMSEYDKIKNVEYVKYLSVMPKEKLLNYYRNNDIFIMPSHRETFGLVYAEAMSQGVPVIYTKGQGFDGQFDEGIVGFHVSDKKPLEIVDAINKILNNYETISHNASIKSEIFNWKEIAKKYRDIYIKILGEKNENKSK